MWSFSNWSSIDSWHLAPSHASCSCESYISWNSESSNYNKCMTHSCDTSVEERKWEGRNEKVDICPGSRKSSKVYILLHSRLKEKTLDSSELSAVVNFISDSTIPAVATVSSDIFIIIIIIIINNNNNNNIIIIIININNNKTNSTWKRQKKNS